VVCDEPFATGASLPGHGDKCGFSCAAEELQVGAQPCWQRVHWTPSACSHAPAHIINLATCSGVLGMVVEGPASFYYSCTKQGFHGCLTATLSAVSLKCLVY
jgi:hypothetical protein